MLGHEIDLLCNYPKSNRDTKGRANVITELDRTIARQYGKDFFDGDRTYGYGGFNYFPRFWQPVVPDLQQHFGLTANSSLLDVGCAKGFMLYDLQQLIPGITLKGIDVDSLTPRAALQCLYELQSLLMKQSEIKADK